ncbi:MAG: class B sortase [Bacilli bacterium]|nr:class B sortase [Bacilli bacterium]
MKKIVIFLVFLLIIISPFYLKPTETKTMLVEQKGAPDKKYPSIREAQEKFQNKEIIGYIDIPNTSIHHYFVQTNDNLFYLNHDLLKKESIFGSVFMDYRNHIGDTQMNLYGHNGNNKNSPFYDLAKYKQEDFYKQHKKIWITSEKGRSEYEVVYVSITAEEKHMNLQMSFQERKQFFEETNLYKTKSSIKEDDQIIVLQTCTYEQENTFLLVVAKKRKGVNL